MTEATIESGIGICISEPVKISVDYEWIMEEIRKRIAYLPDDIERVLMELATEQHN
jgi:uncharacterized small protein (DUF1192 family)